MFWSETRGIPSVMHIEEHSPMKCFTGEYGERIKHFAVRNVCAIV